MFQLLFITFCILSFGNSVSLNEFLALTYDQKIKLDVFRDLVTPNLPHEYMTRDVYLIRWLRDRNFDVAAAEKMLMDHIQWREENAIDRINDEDWSDFDREYKVSVEGCDKEGKPVITVFIGDWDIRKAIIAGKGKRVQRYYDRILEEAETLLRKMQDSGQNVTQATIIIENRNFSPVVHACPRCIAAYFHVLFLFQNHYPGLAHKLIVLNTPQIAAQLWDYYKYIFPPQLRSILEIYGSNKKDWVPVLLKEIDRDQLTTTFGGNKEEAMDYSELRDSGKTLKCSKPHTENELL